MTMSVLITKLRAQIKMETRVFLKILDFEIAIRVSQKSDLKWNETFCLGSLAKVAKQCRDLFYGKMRCCVNFHYVMSRSAVLTWNVLLRPRRHGMDGMELFTTCTHNPK